MCSRQAQVGFEAEGAGVGDVDAVEEGHEVEDDDEGDEVEVDFGCQPAGGGVRGTDDGGGSGGGDA